MKIITLNIPDFIQITNHEVVMILATQLYQSCKLSLGQAAEVAGLTKRTFVELLGKNEVSIFNFPTSDLTNDVANA